METQTTFPIIRMHNIYAGYASKEALHGVDFVLYPGEIHALVGEHRSGKSTLVRLLGGMLRKDAGDITFKGTQIPYFTPKTALEKKIGIIQQHISIPPELTPTEYIFAGRELTHWYGTLNRELMMRKVKMLFAGLNADIPPDEPIESLSQAKQHLVELARVLSIDPEVIIFDEISNRLTPVEMEIIYRLLFELKQQGKSIIYISHNMHEIFKFADRVTILKGGYRQGTEEVRDLDTVKLIKMTYSSMLSREELESDNRELYLLKKYNEDVIKNLPEGVIILNPENQVYLINFAALHILDLEFQAVHAQAIEHILHPEAIELAEDIIEQIVRQEEQVWEELEYQQEKILKLRVSPFKDEDYRFLGTILIIEDISKEHYLNDYLLRAEKIASIAELAAGVAHEINNPLGIIKNYISFLRDKELDFESRDRLMKVDKELDRIVDIVDSLLSFSNVKQLPMKRVNLASVLNEVIVLLHHKFAEKQIRLNWEQSRLDAPVTGDENRLKQVFMNLLVNSIEAVTAGGSIDVEMSIHLQEQYVEALISDNGYGIPPGVAQKIFDPFFSTKSGKKNSGLGLSICQHIIESHQGLITCTSDNCTSFSVRLPLSDETE